MIKGARHAISFNLVQNVLGVESLESFRTSYLTVSIYSQLYHCKRTNGSNFPFKIRLLISSRIFRLEMDCLPQVLINIFHLVKY